MTTDRIMSAIKIDKDLLTQTEIEEATKIIENLKWMAWKSCDNRPYKSMSCLIGYSDGEVHTGIYCYDGDLPQCGFFSSIKDFDIDSTGTPEYWMPTPKLPIKKKSEAA